MDKGTPSRIIYISPPQQRLTNNHINCLCIIAYFPSLSFITCALFGAESLSLL